MPPLGLAGIESVLQALGRVLPGDLVCHAIGFETTPLSELEPGLVVVLHIPLFLALTYVTKAASLVERERTAIAEERDAIAAFQREVSQLGAETSGSTDGGVMTVAGGPTGVQLDRVADKYRETVMAVPHQEPAAERSIEAHMATEFGEEIATAVVKGGAFTRPLKHAVLQQCRELRQRRGELQAMVEDEADRLSGAGDDLREIASSLRALDPESPRTEPFEELVDRWERLGDIEDRCASLIEEQQPGPIAGEWTWPGGEHGFREYLYAELSVEYPVLADGTRLLGRIEAARRSVSQSLTRR